MAIETEKPSKRARARTRAISRLTKALELASNAIVDVERAKMSHYTRMSVCMASDGIRDALKAIFDQPIA
jgi:hypothetical protein